MAVSFSKDLADDGWTPSLRQEEFILRVNIFIASPICGCFAAKMKKGRHDFIGMMLVNQPASMGPGSERSKLKILMLHGPSEGEVEFPFAETRKRRGFTFGGARADRIRLRESGRGKIRLR